MKEANKKTLMRPKQLFDFLNNKKLSQRKKERKKTIYFGTKYLLKLCLD
jgi:hypothetical protein